MNIIDIDGLIKKADELQPLPGSIVKLVALLSNSESNVAEITEVIRFDPALTVKLLRMANSAFSGSATTITTVQEAVSRLGLKRVLSLAVASHTRPLMRPQVKAYGYKEGELWRHSVISMLVAEVAPRFCRVPVPPAASTAALLHDIGKLVMARVLDPDVLNLLGQAQSDGGLTQMEAETQILHVHHGELGGLIARHWNLPDSIIKGITFHHNPELGFDVVCDAVHLADAAAKLVEAKLANRQEASTLRKDCAERLSFQVSDLDRVCTEATTAYSKVAALLGAE